MKSQVVFDNGDIAELTIAQIEPSTVGEVFITKDDMTGRKIQIHIEAGFNNTYRGVILDRKGLVMHSLANVSADTIMDALAKMAKCYEFKVALYNSDPFLL